MNDRGADEGDDGQVERQDEELPGEQHHYLLNFPPSFSIMNYVSLLLLLLSLSSLLFLLLLLL